MLHLMFRRINDDQQLHLINRSFFAEIKALTGKGFFDLPRFTPIVEARLAAF